MTNTLHAHVTTTATDCDGRYDNDYVMINEFIGDFADIRFHERVVNCITSTYAIGYDREGTLTVRNIEGTITLDWSESTDEGGRWSTARFCTDDCDGDERLYRDHTAERAGY